MTQNKDNYILLSLEGNIGSGKTTLLNLIKKTLPQDIRVILQPVPQWQSVGPNKTNVLQCFYKQIDKWGFPFQLVTLLTRLEKWRDQIKQDKCYISQRSIDCDLHVFSKQMLRQGFMNQQQRDVFLHFYQSLKNVFPKSNSQGIIYLKTDPINCYQRLKKRNRSQEQTVSLRYLQELDQLHQKWLLGQNQIRPVLKIDGSQNYLSDQSIALQVSKQVTQFIKSIRES